MCECVNSVSVKLHDYFLKFKMQSMWDVKSKLSTAGKNGPIVSIDNMK